VGARSAIYVVGVVVILIGLYLLLTATGILEGLVGDRTATALVVALIVILLGMGFMAASSRLPKARRYYSARSSAASPREVPRSRESIIREGPAVEGEEYLED
jgi:uncharacterized membrane protein